MSENIKNISAAERKAAVEKEGLQNISLMGKGCVGGVLRNGEVVVTLGRLVERDAAVEATGGYRAPHGAEADILFQKGGADGVATQIALARAASNGRNVFWEGQPGGAASSPNELGEAGATEARKLAFLRKDAWGEWFTKVVKTNFDAATMSPQGYAETPRGNQWFAGNPQAGDELSVVVPTESQLDEAMSKHYFGWVDGKGSPDPQAFRARERELEQKNLGRLIASGEEVGVSFCSQSFAHPLSFGVSRSEATRVQ